MGVHSSFVRKIIGPPAFARQMIGLTYFFLKFQNAQTGSGSKVKVKVNFVEKRFHAKNVSKNRIYGPYFDVYPPFSRARNRMQTTRKVSDQQGCQILAKGLSDQQFPS